MKTRKLRHLRCIHIRNVDSTKYVADQGSGNDDESSCILATIVDSTNNEIVWKSTAEYDYDQAINASFSFMPSGQLDKILSDNFTIQIHKNSSCLLAEFSVDFSHVLYAGENMTNLCIHEYPVNSLFLEFVDGIYIAHVHHFENYEERTKPSKALKVDGNINYVALRKVENAIQKLVGLHYAIENEEETCTQLKNTVDNYLATTERIRLLKQQISSKKASIEQLQDTHDRTRFLFEERKRQFKFKQNLISTHKEQLNQSTVTLQANMNTLTLHESARIPKLRSQLDILGSRCDKRQQQIAGLIAKCFEVAPDKSGKFLTINGLAIFKNEQLSTDDEAASALGFVCQCVRIFSKLYQIPLKYQVFPLASRSFVRDDDTTDQKLLLPLFMMRASEKPKYFRAVLLLNLNILHLLKVRGVQATLKNKFDVLETLDMLFQSSHKI